MLSAAYLSALLVHLIFLLPLAHAGARFPRFETTLGLNAQKYAVGKLPHVDYQLPPSWAGQIHVPGTKDDELFFWLFEAEIASKNLIIWLNGGPGCSSMDGLTKENGPLFFPGNSSTPKPNVYSWTKLAHVLYIDQPIGTGFSAGSNGADNNAEITQDFYAWLKAFYAQFPGLLSLNTYLMGESYAGIYIPYFTQAILANKKGFPLNLKSITIGDGSWGNWAALTDVTINAFMHEQNHLLKIPRSILTAFDHADRQCGFDRVLKQIEYPPGGKIRIPGDPEGNNHKRQDDCFPRDPDTPARINESVNALCYGGCATWSTAFDFLQHKQPCFSQYNINYTCGTVPSEVALEAYLNLPSVQKAIHAPTKKFETCNNTLLSTLSLETITPPAYSIMPAILKQNIKIHIYSADYDFLFNHIGTELMIQNMTWMNKQGFRSPPNKKFLVDGKVAGNWGAERGLSYHHILHAGHGVPTDQPSVAFAYVRDFVLKLTGHR